MKNLVACFCGREVSFELCCGPLLAGQKIAQTAEQLMRSRFSAFCTGNADYLITSHHSSKRSANDKQELEDSFKQSEWLQLTIIESNMGLASDSHGEVEFVAIYRQNEEVSRLHERSQFVKENGLWFYVDGVLNALPDTRLPKRNESCWCGSGKKFKRCHG